MSELELKKFLSAQAKSCRDTYKYRAVVGGPAGQAMAGLVLEL